MTKLSTEEEQKLTVMRRDIETAKLEFENARLREDLVHVQMQLYISSLYIKYRMTENDKISPTGEIIYKDGVNMTPDNDGLLKKVNHGTKNPLDPDFKPPIIKYGDGELLTDADIEDIVTYRKEY
jgi:hypothetical protein